MHDQAPFTSETVQNRSKQICQWVLIVGEQQEMDFFTGGSVIMDYRLIFWLYIR